MSYLVLARKYRPQSFDDVVAQEHVTRTIRNAVKNDKIGSGYLFTGPRGTGKTTVARLLAKAINCDTGPTETPCGTCSACKEIAAGSSMDVLEIDAASNTGVDDIRQLRENVRYMPSSEKKKRVYIIDEVHRLSGSAFDALLKTLEEPPEHVVFIFATTDPIKVPDTILSRTQRFDFRRVTLEDLSAHLGRIASMENITVDDTALSLIARKGDGSVRDSMSLLDQVAAFAGDAITAEDVVSALGLVDRSFLLNYTRAIAESDRKEVLTLTRQLFEGGIATSDFVAELLEHLRTLMIIDSDPESVSMLGLSSEETATCLEQAKYFTTGDLLRLMKVLSELSQDLKGGLDERLLVEIAGVKMAEMESTVRLEDILAQLQSGALVAPSAPAAGDDLFGASQKKKSELVNERPAPAPGRQVRFVKRPPNLAQVKADWNQFLSRIRSENPMVASQLAMARLRAMKESTLDLIFSASEEASLNVVRKPENFSLITRTLAQHYGANLSVTMDIDASAPPHAGAQAPVQKVDAGELLKKSPRLKQLVDKVDGEIIGVRKVK